MSPIPKFDSAYLKGDVNVYKGDSIRFLNAGEYDKNGQLTINVGIIPKGIGDVKEQKLFSLNKRNYEATAKVFGKNTDDWVDKEMEVNVIETENPRTGELVPAVRLVAPRKELKEDNFDLPSSDDLDV